MALRDQPYIPLYYQDYLTDEKLNLCSAATQGVYIKIICIFHKSETYGGILFKQNNKQNLSMHQYFAWVIQKQIGFTDEEIKNALEELLENKVLTLEEDFLFQKRMVKDFSISEKRSQSAKKGGGNPNLFKQKDKQIIKQTLKQIPENENENENNNSNKGNSDELKEKVIQKNPDTLCYNVEELLLKDHAKLEAICMKSSKTLDFGKNELMKCHLFLEKHEKYPMQKKAAIAWFNSWLINSADYNAKYGAAKTEKKPNEPINKPMEEIIKKYSGEPGYRFTMPKNLK